MRLQHTAVTPYLDRKIEPGTSLVWCATFQMAWDELKKLSGGPVKTSPGCVEVSKLNRESVAPADIPEAGALSLAGMIGEGVRDRIRTAVRALGDGAEPRLLPAEDLPAGAVVVYACLRRSVKFKTPFAPLRAMDFGVAGRRVECFGIEDYSASSKAKREQGRQVRVVWHRFLLDPAKEMDQEFVLELLTPKGQDRLLLARLAPRATLKETVDHVLALARHPNSKTAPDGIAKGIEQLEARAADVGYEPAVKELCEALSACSGLLTDEDVRIPRIRFDVIERFAGLLGQVVLSDNEIVDGKPIVDARQSVRFRLDEAGAAVDSEAVGSLFGGLPGRDFSFSGPFLVLMMRRDAKAPYLALWVANSELLAAGGKE